MVAWMLIIGASVTVVGGFVLTLLLLVATSWAAGRLSHVAYKRLLRVYHLNVVWYWLHRLEKEGTHCFQKAEPEPTEEVKS